ncbi:MAG TPA: TlpA disulfide reductase family protein [Usitatibacter sp.]|nr:TlpA disulfide reductase family protein [Usitatibacter sp.]
MRSALVLAICLAASLSPPASAVGPGSQLPGITAPRLADPAHRVDFAALHGDVVYVDFWASWCVPCRQSMPQLDQLYRRYQARGFRVVGVNKDVATADALRFLTRVDVSFPLVADGDDSVAKAFDVQAMPSGYLVDRNGVVRYVHRGFSADTAVELRTEIESLLGSGA